MNKPPRTFKLKGFHPSSIPNDPDRKSLRLSQLFNHYIPSAVPFCTPDTTPIIPTNPVKPEVVLFVGFPAVGKSTFYRKHFAPAGYVHVNQDTLRTKDKCIKLIRQSIEEGKSCVVGQLLRRAYMNAKDVPSRQYE